jgi:hypothetical protein
MIVATVDLSPFNECVFRPDFASRHCDLTAQLASNLRWWAAFELLAQFAMRHKAEVYNHHWSVLKTMRARVG